MDINKSPVSLVIDIDGVLVKHHKKIEGSTEAIRLLQSKQIPFVFFTNNTSKNEQTKADQLTQILELQDNPIKKQQVVLNYTPIKNTFKCWHDKVVMFIGRENQLAYILPFQEIPFYVTIEEYCTMFPQAVPLNKRSNEQQQKVKDRVSQRLNLTQKIDMMKLKFDLIFIVNSPIKWEQSLQVIIDLLSTDNGTIQPKGQYVAHQTHIPIYTALNDLWYRKDHPLPRILLKPFILALEAVYKEIYKKQIKITHYGKPTRNSFQYVHRHLVQNHYETKHYIMIGDNIDTDIVGAYNYGWKSVLVKTGVSRHNSELATHFCDNILQAVQWSIQNYYM